MATQDKKAPAALFQCLQVCFVNKLRQAISHLNDSGFNTLDLVVRSKSTDTAEAFLHLFGSHIELECLYSKPQ